MKTAISTACFGCETEDAAKQIKSLGAQNAEISFKTFYEYRPEFSKRLAPEIQGLNVISVRTFAPNFEYQLFGSSRRIRGDGFYWLDQLMRSMQLLGAVRYVLQGEPFLAGSDIGNTVSGLRETVSFCSRYGVGVCLENDGVSAPKLYAQLRERVPEISFSLDITKVRRSGYPAGMFAAAMGQSVSQIRLNCPDCVNEKFTIDEILHLHKNVVFSGDLVLSGFSGEKDGGKVLKKVLSNCENL